MLYFCICIFILYSIVLFYKLMAKIFFATVIKPRLVSQDAQGRLKKMVA